MLLFLCGFNLCVNAQTYGLKPIPTAVLATTGVITAAYGTYLTHQASRVSLPELRQLSMDDINGLDRHFAENYQPKAAQISDWVTAATIVSPALLLADAKVRDQWVTIGIMGAETMLLTYGLTSITKGAVLRIRPLAYNHQVPVSERTAPDVRLSFFSRHVSMASAATFFAAQVYADLHAKGNAQKWIWGTAAILPIATASLRVASGAHFVTDVATGYAVGACIGVLVPLIHRSEAFHHLTVAPMINGIYVNWQF